MSLNDVLLSIELFMLGASIGSALLCASDRAGKEWMKGRSRCDSCGHVLAAYELIPVFSYLLQKGKCRWCGAEIPMECLKTEILSGIAYLILFWIDRLSVQLVQDMALLTVLVILLHMKRRRRRKT